MTETPNMDHIASVVAWLRGQEWVGEKPTRGQSADAIEQLCSNFEKAEQALADTKEENERLTDRLAAEGRAWDILIGCCYDELTKALGRDIECPAYIPDAIKELAALALRGEPTMGMWDDFCFVFPVPFDDFLKAYKFMVGNMPALRGEPVAKEAIVEIADRHVRQLWDTVLDIDFQRGIFESAILEALALYAAPISGERAIPAGHCTLFVPHSSACAQQAQCLAVSGERDAKKIVCHAEGPRCHGCAHYRGEADICVYAPAVSGEREQVNRPAATREQQMGSVAVNECDAKSGSIPDGPAVSGERVREALRQLIEAEDDMDKGTDSAKMRRLALAKDVARTVLQEVK